MAPKKKVTPVVEESAPPASVPRTQISPLSIDYPSEQLNDMARKINEVIEHINAL